jgi:hypothetical protein
LDDDDVALPPVRSVICLRPGDPAGRDAAALACDDVVAVRPGDPAGRDEDVVAPEFITCPVAAFVDAGGTYDGGGVPDELMLLIIISCP